jgi:hypothetical protein
MKEPKKMTNEELSILIDAACSDNMTYDELEEVGIRLRNHIPKPRVEVEHSTQDCRVRINGISVYSDFDDDGFCSMLATAIRAALELEAKP